jgi:hypothetical protein
LIPAGIALRAEEIGAHVIVYAMRLPAETAKIIDYFGTD